MGRRVFFALDIDEATRRRIVACVDRLQFMPGRVNWTKARNLHVTMNFIGDVRDTRIGPLCELVKGAIAGWDLALEELTFTIDRLICFPPTKRPRMIWAPVGGGCDELASLHDTLNLALKSDGWNSESRPFKGHVTVARLNSADAEASAQAAVAGLDDEQLGAVTATELTLYQSELKRTGPNYTSLASIPLRRQE